MAMESGKPGRVAAIFELGERIRPVWFEMGGRQHKVGEVTYYWTDRAGEALLMHFAVVTVSNGDQYELVYNTLDQSWTIRPPSFP